MSKDSIVAKHGGMRVTFLKTLHVFAMKAWVFAGFRETISQFGFTRHAQQAMQSIHCRQLLLCLLCEELELLTICSRDYLSSPSSIYECRVLHQFVYVNV